MKGGLWDQMKYEAGKLPIDRLRDGTMTDDEVRFVAAETVRNSVALRDPARTTFDALADRLMLVRLAEPRQTRACSTRACSTYWPGASHSHPVPRQ